MNRIAITVFACFLMAQSVHAQWIEYLEEPSAPDLLIMETISRNGRFAVATVQRRDVSGVVRWDDQGRLAAFPDPELDLMLWPVVADDGRVFGTRTGPLPDSDRWIAGGEWTHDGFQTWPDVLRLLDMTSDGRASLILRTNEGSTFSSLALRAGNDLVLDVLAANTWIDRARISEDASIAVGVASQSGSRTNFRFGADGSTTLEGYRLGHRERFLSRSGAVMLGSLSDGTFDGVPIRIVNGTVTRLADSGNAWSLSDDGNVVVMLGPSTDSEFNDWGVWTPEAGFRTLRERGFAYHIGMDIPRTPSISGDGTVLCGTIWWHDGPRAYRDLPARFHLAPRCPVDYATDGMVDLADYAAFIACFEGDCPNHRSADFNTDGFVDFFDYSDFVDAFQRGC